MSDLSNDLVIDDSNYSKFIGPVVVDGQSMSRGAIPRDYSKYGLGHYQGVVPFNIRLTSRNEWSSRIKDQEQSQSRLSDLRMIGDNGNPIKSTDQNGRGYCWSHSPISAAMLVRCRDNQPYVRLSAYAAACKIKNYRDQGGWNAQAVEYLIKYGCPDVQHWPEKSTSRSNDNAATWANAAKYQLTEGFMDLTPAQYDRNLSFDQLATCLLNRIPCPIDLNWWGHSVCAVDLVEVDSSLPLSDIRRWGVRIWNSWTDSWGTLGMGVLIGSKAVPNGATAVSSLELAA